MKEKSPLEFFKAFWRYYHKVKQVIEELQKGGAGSIKIESKRDPKTGQNTMRVENNIAHNPLVEQFLALMANRFINPLDNLYFIKIWDFLKTNFGKEIEPNLATQVDDFITQINGNSNIKLNNRVLKVEDIVKAIGQGDFFGQPGEGRDLLAELTTGPFGGVASAFAWQQYYQFNISVFNLASELFNILVKIKKSQNYYTLFEESEDNFCIFCLTDSNTFNSEEHIIPEALGNSDVTLPPGYVCDKCNNILSEIDNTLKEFTPLAFIALSQVPYTKKGKFPTAKFEGVAIKKTRPAHLLFNEQAKNPNKRAIKNIQEYEDGTVTFNVEIKGKNPNWIKLSRALYKIALEEIALQQGREIACDKKYDAARQFILKGGAFDNNVLFMKKGDPDFPTQVVCLPLDQGTIFQIQILGVSFLFNLEENPKIEVAKLAEFLNVEEKELHEIFLEISLTDGTILSGQS